ncbi:MAG: hypothetical protein D6732_08675 [Methanobacteriota archaeon]|nr:MAG: hypothetical protein D6732_08675 [Euryarchaeota archaeon]
MSSLSAFQTSRTIDNIFEQKGFIMKLNRWAKILAVLSSYFQIFGNMLNFLIAIILLPDSIPIFEKIFGFSTWVLFPLGLIVALKSKNLFQDPFMGRLLSFSIVDGLIMHIVFEHVILLPISLTLSFLIIHELTELTIKKFYFSRIDMVLEEEREIDPSLISLLQDYFEDRIRWITIVAGILAIVNLVVYLGTFFPRIFNPITSTVSFVILVFFGSWLFFSIPTRDN